MICLPRRLVLLSLAALAFCATTLLGSTYTWKSVAMNGGGFVSGLLYHPTEPGVFYARTDVGGAYRWDGLRKTWVALNDDLGNDDFQLLGIVSFAVDARDPDALYLAGGQYLPWWGHNGAILRSHDRGRTWQRTDLTIKLGGNSDGRSAGERLQVDPNDGRILFLGTNQDGLWKSTDSGATWSKVTAFSPVSVNCLASFAGSGSSGTATPVWYAGINTTSSASVYKSSDGGASWSPVAGYPAGLMAYRLVVDVDGTVYGTFTDGLGPNGISKGSVWKLSASGTWTNISPPAGQGGFAGISLCSSSPGTLVVSTLDRWSPGDTVYRSTNYGASWTEVLNRSLLDVSQAPWAASSSPHWLGDVQVNPFDGNEASFVTGYGLFSTANLKDGAASNQVVWRFNDRGLEETVPLSLISPPEGAHLISAVGDIDGFKHDDLETPPSSRLSPMIGTCRSLDFAALAPSVMVRLGDNAGQYSSDGGAHWTAFASKPSFGSNQAGKAALNADATRFYWTPEKATLFVSTNNGASWSAATGLPSTTNAAWTPIADRVNPLQVYVYDQASKKLYRSVNGGVSFTAGSNTFPYDWSAGTLRAVPGKEGHLWLALWGTGLFRSTDGGQNFSQVTSVDDGYRVTFGMAASGATYPAVYIFGKVGGVEGLYRSDDEGVSWTRINDDRHRFGNIGDMTGDPRIYGRVYLASGGRGVIYGDFAAPQITAHPTSAFVSFPENSLTLSVTASGDGLTYQWYRNGAAIEGATASSYALSDQKAGDYQVVVTGLGGSTTSRFARVVNEAPGTSRLANISIRAVAGRNGLPLICGFVSTGGPKSLLVRVAGPALAGDPFNVAGTLADPKLAMHHYVGSEDVTGDVNDNWADGGLASTLSEAFSKAGAFAFVHEDGKDAALQTVIDGPYTAHANSETSGSSGVVLVEGYDSDLASASRLMNLSARNYCGVGADVMIAGFVVHGKNAKTLLIRGVGPGLSQFGLKGVLPDCYLELRGTVNGVAQTLIAANDDWKDEPGISSAAAKAGAFSLPAGSGDSAILVTLPPGDYTAVLSGIGGSTGEGLIEVYEILP